LKANKSLKAADFSFAMEKWSIDKALADFVFHRSLVGFVRPVFFAW